MREKKMAAWRRNCAKRRNGESNAKMAAKAAYRAERKYLISAAKTRSVAAAMKAAKMKSEA